MTVKDETRAHHQEGTLEPGSIFGEVALIAGCKRTATVKALNYTMCTVLDKTSFVEFLRWFPYMNIRFHNNMTKYRDHWI